MGYHYAVKSTRHWHYVMVRDNEQSKWEHYKVSSGKPVKYAEKYKADQDVQWLTNLYGKKG